ncbi:MAG TPA: HAMP domain-containing sensor histidine kinase, partial [Ktedonobacteraceae bacterium]|nr:HAMP domain-containing sensor histidine kinase [Ktedonobacteraceae bacterium]
MQVKNEQSQEELIKELKHQIDELSASKLVLEEQLARKEQFTAMIAHELRGPLTPIISYAQMIGRAKNRPELIERNTKIIISQAQRSARLVNDLLDASRLSTGQFKLVTASCDAVSLVREVVEQLRPVAPYHHFELHLPDEPVIGNWDGGRIQQALGNLLDNAVKYSDPNTVVTITLIKQAESIYFSVHNQGASIPSDETSQLFRPYVRLQGTIHRQGSGLGLYITKSIIEAHGGSLRLEPNNLEGQGTTFSFELPFVNNTTI